jgi:hypothetical protein
MFWERSNAVKGMMKAITRFDVHSSSHLAGRPQAWLTDHGVSTAHCEHRV